MTGNEGKERDNKGKKGIKRKGKEIEKENGKEKWKCFHETCSGSPRTVLEFSLFSSLL